MIRRRLAVAAPMAASTLLTLLVVAASVAEAGKSKSVRPVEPLASTKEVGPRSWRA